MRTSLFSTIGRQASVAGLVLVATAALVLTMWVGSHDDVAQAASTSGASSDRADMKADLSKAKDLTGQERREAVAKIRDDARSGEYGDAIAKRTERKHDRAADRRAVVMALLPDQLQEDLTSARKADGDDRKKAMEAIRSKALDGGYGEQVEAAAELRQSQRDKS